MTIYKLIDKISKSFRYPLSIRLLFSVRGIENLHIYLWISKDFCWLQEYKNAGITFGILAIILTLLLFYNAITTKNTEEFIFLIPISLWLTGNFIWMSGEFSDELHFNSHTIGGYFIFVSMIIAQLYHIILKWFVYIKNNESTIAIYTFEGFIPYFTYFKNWRQYEFFHIMCWIGKDLSWNLKMPIMWIICTTLTFIISLDFIRVTLNSKRLAMDLIHYIVQFIWICANIVWSAGEIFDISSDDTHSLFTYNPITSRWIASEILFIAYIILAIFYIVWIPLSYFDKINDNNNILS